MAHRFELIVLIRIRPPASSRRAILAFCPAMLPTFIVPSPLVSPKRSRALPVKSQCMRRPRPAQCNLRSPKKMLVVDLQELLRPSANDASDFTELSERVEVERNNSNSDIFLLFSSSSGYDASMASIQDVGLIEPDALTTLNGTELYQRQYRTPDPLWAKTVCQGWTSKPIVWVTKQFFGDDVEEVSEKAEFEISVRCKDGASMSDVVDGLSKKLGEMGITGRVMVGEEAGALTIVPAAGSAADVITFCQTMMKIEENETFVFGGDELIEKCVGGKGNLGLTCASSEHKWAAFDGRVFVSNEVGGKALLDGLMHYAVF